MSILGNTLMGNPALGALPGMGGAQSGGAPGLGPVAPRNPMPGALPGGTTTPAANPFGGVNPFMQSVMGSMNGQPVPFNASQYVTPQAAQQLAQRYGASLAQTNVTPSPGSGVPNAAGYGLDFGYGELVDPAALATWHERGDSQAEIDKRIAAGIAPYAFHGATVQGPSAEAWKDLAPRGTGNWSGAASGAASPAAPPPANPWAQQALQQFNTRRAVAPSQPGPMGTPQGRGAEADPLIGLLKILLGL